MSKIFVVGYDDSPSSRRAVDYVLAQAEEQKAGIVIAHVLEWSPYSFLTPEELEERHQRRKEELSRAEAAVIQPLVDQIVQKGIQVESELRYGNIADTLCEIAKEKNASQLVVGRTGDAGVVSRIFGSVAAALAQSSPVPCTIIP
ncbi:MAG: universal stress protein [Thiolinea sp.]